MSRVTLRVLIVDDHPLFIDALKLALAPLAEASEVDAAMNLAEAGRRLAAAPADLVLLDLSLPDAGGVESVAQVRQLAPKARLLVVSGQDDPATVGMVRALGADGFIPKATPLTVIQDQLRRALAGEAVFPEAAEPSAVGAALASLTLAQVRVLAAAATGKLNKQIAHEMNLAEPTIKAHMSAIIKRLGVANRTQAILLINNRL